jgi:hypothetical protein
MTAAIQTADAVRRLDPFAAEPCCLVGPEHGQPTCEHWRRLEDLDLLAHLRGNLEDLALRVASEFRTLDFPLTVEGLSDAMLIGISKANPRSKIVPWHLPDSTVKSVTPIVARKVVEEVGR